MKLDGTINAQDLSITAGANRYDYVSRSVTGAVPGAGTTPAYAIDSTALGGMYANRIRLTATEAGVGVRMLGDAAASADDFTLSAAGRIELQNRISAQRDVLVASTSNEATALALSNASLSSGRDTSLTATGGAGLNASVILAAGNWRGRFGAIATGAGTRFQSSGRLEASTTSGDMNLGSAALLASGDLLLTTVGKLAVANDAAQGIASLGGNVVLTAARGLDNAGSITAGKGAATLRVDGAIDNSGTVHAATTLDIADRNGTGTQALINSGNLLAERDLALKAAAIRNTTTGRVQADAGSRIDASSLDNAGAMLLSRQANANGIITLTGTFLNDTGGVTTLAATSGGGGTVTANQIINKGTLQSVGNLSLAAGAGGLNTTGSLLSNGALNIGARGANNYTAALNGIVQAVGKLSVQQGTGNSTLSIGSGKTVSGGTVDIDMNTVTLNKDAVLSSAGNLDLDAATLTLGGDNTSTARVMAAIDVMGGGGTGNITVRNDLTNDGLLYSRDALNVTAPNITISGTGGIAALGDVTVKANAGTLTLASGPSAGAGNLVNNGAIYAGRNLSVTANGTLTNSSTINAVGAMTLRANTAVNNRDIVSDGSIDIVANTIRNEVAGGDTRYWTKGDTTTVKQREYNDGGADGNLEVFKDYKSTWTEYQRYKDDVAPRYSPQILATTNLRLTFHTGSNLGGTIYGGNSVALQGFSFDSTQHANALRDFGIRDDAGNGFRLGGDATFANDSLALQARDYTRYYTLHTKYIALGPAKFYTDKLCKGRFDDAMCGYRKGYNDSYVYREHKQLNAGIHTQTLTASGIALSNKGAVTTDVNSVKEGTTRPNTIGTVLDSNTVRVGSTSLNGATTGNAAHGVNGTSFGGISMPLPISPSGLFVVARDPAAKYLVETNPLYMDGTATYGSDYLTKMLGYSADEISLRLGDASYENYLVKQQLIAQTGNVMLGRYRNADAQMQGLFDNASAQTKSLGLELGKALTPEQQANLKQDIVWMVQTVVDGRTVLAPVVYLSQSTKAAVSLGAVISAQDANLNLTSLTNMGGTIVGGKSLVARSAGDIANTSGVIKGGNVSLKSTAGSIVNKTFSTSNGTTDLFQQTTVGQTGSIQSTGTLALDAKKDITNLGATMTAGTDASLKAGNNITFDTIENKNTSTTGTNRGKGTTTTTTTTVEQVKSGLTVGGNLSAQAGNDITLAGTDAKVGRNADLNAGNNVSIVARENTTTTHTTNISSGFGQNNSVYGSTKVTSDSTSVRNVGSDLQVGGNANVTAKNDVTVQGSDVVVKGKGTINATNVNVLAGRNYDETRTTTERSGILQVSAGGDTSASADASASSTSGRARGAAAAGASAEVKGNGSADLVFGSTTRTQTDTTDLRHVRSNVNFGGDVTINASQDVNLQGSKIKAGGNAIVNARNVNLLATEDKKTSNTTSTTTKVGLMASSNNKAGVYAKAGADGYAGNGNAHGTAKASAVASADSENRVALVRHSTTTTSSLDTRHHGSAISAGGDLNVKATNGLTLEGSQLASGGNMKLDARDMHFKAVNDVHETRSSGSTTTAGLYLKGNATASATADAAVGLGAQLSASAEATARADAGLYGSNTRTSNVDGSTTAVTSGISAGGNIKRTATNSIKDVGTQISAGGGLTQSAQTITSEATANTTYSSSRSTTHTARLGVYAEATAGVTANAAAGPGAVTPPPPPVAEIAGGITASYQRNDASKTSNTSDVVVSNIKVGGSVTSTSVNATTLEGTKIDAGKNVTLNAGSLDYRAAASTASNTSDGTYANGKLDINLVNIGGAAAIDYRGDKSSDSSSTAVAGGINAGGKLSVNVKSDARFEGTNLAAGEGASLTSGGKLTFDAARNTSSSSSQGVDVNAGVSTYGVKPGGNVSVTVSTTSESRDTEVAGSIGGGKGPLTIRSGGDATFTGTALSSGGEVAVDAGGNLTFNAARDKRTSQTVTVDAGATVLSSQGLGSARAGGGNQSSQSDTASAASIKSGDNIKLTAGGNLLLEGTRRDANGVVTIAAGGTLTEKEAVSTSSETDFRMLALPAAGSGGKPRGMRGGANTSRADSGAGASTRAPGKASGGSQPVVSGTQGAIKIGANGSKIKTTAGDADALGKPEGTVSSQVANGLLFQGLRTSAGTTQGAGDRSGVNLTDGGRPSAETAEHRRIIGAMALHQPPVTPQARQAANREANRNAAELMQRGIEAAQKTPGAPMLTDGDRRVIKQYVRSPKPFNAPFMPKQAQGSESPVDPSRVTELNSALAKLPNTTEVTYRGVITPKQIWGTKIQPGDVVVSTPFTSTSMSLNVAKDFSSAGNPGHQSVFRILGQTGKNIAGMGLNESEVLFQPGTRFDVQTFKKEGNTTYVLLSENTRRAEPSGPPDKNIFTGAPDYKRRVVVQAGNDPVTAKAAQALADKYYGTELLKVGPQGSLEGAGSFAQPVGSVKVSVVGHGDNAGGGRLGGKTAAEVAALATLAAGGADNLKKLSLVGCNTACMRDDVAAQLSAAALQPSVSGQQGPIRVGDDGRKVKSQLTDKEALGKPGESWASSGWKSSTQNAQDHWQKHKQEFPQYNRWFEYAAGAQKFTSNPPSGTQTKPNGTGGSSYYNPNSNVFAATNSRGQTMTMFKPSGGGAYWAKQ
ncbi:hemagglutinin repeat-containing protein [Cupriavidus pampae]|uniref:hemagglutinin repeat-containing protein n=1 Tax=Cupriavidus pampae TaxID=659251 RepID=UPI0036190619